MTSPRISIVIATYDRPASLIRCLRSLRSQRIDEAFEILVVDNHPQSGQTRPVRELFPEVCWLEEPAAGLSRARNRAIPRARGSIIVTTDDDVIAPSGWLASLTAALWERPELAGTTGNCLPLKTETEAERVFEAYGGLRHGTAEALYDARWLESWRFRIPPLWRIGTTANAAFRRAALEAIGLFDTRLGAGSPAGAWEDLYAFYRILRAGGAIAYKPEAELWHAHRETMEGLARQLIGYRRGEAAFLTLVWQAHRDWRAWGQALLWIPKWRLTQAAGELVRRARGRRQYPFWLIGRECRAYFDGPAALRASVQINGQATGSGAQAARSAAAGAP